MQIATVMIRLESIPGLILSTDVHRGRELALCGGPQESAKIKVRKRLNKMACLFLLNLHQ